MVREPLTPVLDIIPHRPPFLFLDQCLKCTEDEVVGEHLFSQGADFFRGHFPDFPIVPGVILVEGLAQTLAYLALSRTSGGHVLLTGVDKCRIRQPVHPGERVRYRVKVNKVRMNWVFARGEVTRDETTILTADLKGYIQAGSNKD